MRSELTAILEIVCGTYTAYCPEIPEAKGRGASKMAALVALQQDVSRLFDTRRETAIRGAAADATFDSITVN